MQSHLIVNLKKKFGVEVSEIQSYTTPGSPCLKILKPKKELEGIRANLQSTFRSGAPTLQML
jgi:hypothetical protein